MGLNYFLRFGFVEKRANEYGPKNFDMQKILTDLLVLIHSHRRPDTMDDECLLETCLKTMEVIDDLETGSVEDVLEGTASGGVGGARSKSSCKLKSCPHWKEFVSYVQVTNELYQDTKRELYFSQLSLLSEYKHHFPWS